MHVLAKLIYAKNALVYNYCCVRNYESELLTLFIFALQSFLKRYQPVAIPMRYGPIRVHGLS